MTENELTIKGIRAGVLVTIANARWSKQRDILIKHLQTQERFFKGGRIALDLGGTEWTLDELRSLLRDVGDEGVCLWAILSTNLQTIQAAEALELATKVKPDHEDEIVTPPSTHNPNTLWLSALPAGERVFDWDGDLVLIGDLPTDREVHVTGNVIVWGKAMGVVRFGTDEPDKSQLKLLACENPTVYLNNKLIDLPKKLRKGQAISVGMVGGKVVVDSHLKGGFKLL